jgi:hypothetical protein
MPRDALHVGFVVVDARACKVFSASAAAVAAQAQRMRGKTVLREVRQKMIVPAPGGDKSAVHEQELSGMSGGCRYVTDQFEAVDVRYAFHARPLIN